MTEQELILTSILNCERLDLAVNPRDLTFHEKERMEKILQRRKQGEPLQYILGSCEFFGLKFLVDKNVLIPRFETELLVEKAAAKAKELSLKSLNILDIGTGSGNIAVSLAKSLPSARVTAIDVAPYALKVAMRNADVNSVLEQVEFVESDLFAKLLRSQRQKHFGGAEKLQNQSKEDVFFDMIISNPPYVMKCDLETLPLEVRQEPRIALDGGEDGLEFYRRIIDEAPEFLKPNGFIFFEIGDGQGKAVCEILKQKKCFQNIECSKDFNQKERILSAEKK